MNERTVKSEVDRAISEQMRRIALMRKSDPSEVNKRGWITRRANLAKRIRSELSTSKAQP